MSVQMTGCLDAEYGGGIGLPPSSQTHFISVLASETVRRNAAHKATMTIIIFLGYSGDCVRQLRHHEHSAYSTLTLPELDLRPMLKGEISKPFSLPKIKEGVRFADAPKLVVLDVVVAPNAVMNSLGCLCSRIYKSLSSTRSLCSTSGHIVSAMPILTRASLRWVPLNLISCSPLSTASRRRATSD